MYYEVEKIIFISYFAFQMHIEKQRNGNTHMRLTLLAVFFLIRMNYYCIDDLNHYIKHV